LGRLRRWGGAKKEPILQGCPNADLLDARYRPGYTPKVLNKNFTLYVDESGSFSETARDQDERIAWGSEHDFPSQFGGILAPNFLTWPAAEKIMEKAREAAGLASGAEVHATDLKRDRHKDYLSLVRSVFQSLKAAKIRAVRFSNSKKVTYADRKSAMVNLLAELSLSCLESLSHSTKGKIWISVKYSDAVYGKKLPGKTGLIFGEEDLVSLVSKRIHLSAQRRGIDARNLRWGLNTVERGSAKRDPRLQICDIVSNVSVRDFGGIKADPELHAEVTKMMEDWCFEHRDPGLIEDIAIAVESGNIANALILLSENQSKRSVLSKRDWNRVFKTILEGLKRESGRYLRSLINPVIEHIEFLIESRTSLKVGSRMCSWLISNVFKELRGAVPDDILNIATFNLRRLELTAANHTGDVKDAARILELLGRLSEETVPSLEILPSILEAEIGRAVYLNDLLDFESAEKILDRAEALYAPLYAHLLRIHPTAGSDILGKILGTRLQSGTGLILQKKGSPKRTRKDSDGALTTFKARFDIQRQHQYRAHFEACCGDYETARRHLALSNPLMNGKDPSHRNIIRTLEEIEDEEVFKWNLMHWLRLGATAIRNGDRGEADEFVRTIIESDSMLEHPLLRRKDIKEYPAHGIRRSVAVIFAYSGDDKRLNGSLQNLRLLVPKYGAKEALLCVVIAGHLETAGLKYLTSAVSARKILDDREGAAALIRDFRKREKTISKPIDSVFTDWLNIINTKTTKSPQEYSRTLIEAAKIIPN